jgi:hypothetical protein
MPCSKTMLVAKALVQHLRLFGWPGGQKSSSCASASRAWPGSSGIAPAPEPSWPCSPGSSGSAHEAKLAMHRWPCSRAPCGSPLDRPPWALQVGFFWRSWNLPVHTWMVAHVYLPLTRRNWSRRVCWLPLPLHLGTCIHFQAPSLVYPLPGMSPLLHVSWHACPLSGISPARHIHMHAPNLQS